jgi:ATP-dependent 26S proteasome regulatory subunit
MVDKSLIRSGRFDIKIQVNLPPLDMKVKIFEKYIKKTKNNLNE